MHGFDWEVSLLTVKSKKYYFKGEVDTLLQKLQQQWDAQQRELEECKAALENYQAQERKIASILISSQQLADQQIQMMREKARNELLEQEEKRRKAERETALLIKQQKENKAEYYELLQELCCRIQQELVPILEGAENKKTAELDC